MYLKKLYWIVNQTNDLSKTCENLKILKFVIIYYNKLLYKLQMQAGDRLLYWINEWMNKEFHDRFGFCENHESVSIAYGH